MANRNEPTLSLRDYLAFTKLLHAFGSIYIWETVFTIGFELNVLRGKQPYRWTIWIYLATRYTCLLAFILFFIANGGGQVPCQAISVTGFALSYTSWAFASLIILLRVIAIWNQNIIVSSIAVFTWLGALGLNIRTVAMIEATYDPVIGACTIINTYKSMVGTAAILVIDTLLLVMMLIGLLRFAHRSSTGIWYLLYKQCIIWIILAAVAEIPVLVLQILNLNDAWNQMFLPTGITILTICAARMYRSLCQHGSLTEYLSDTHQFSAGFTISNHRPREAHRAHSTVHFATAGTVTQSDRRIAEPPLFIPADMIQPEFVPGSSNTTLTVPAKNGTK